VPLIALALPCGMRALALSVLERAGRQVVPVFTSGSLLGLLAAVEAGLGVAVLGYESLKPGLRVLGRREGLPDLGSSTIALIGRPRADKSAAAAMGEALRDSLKQLQR
jgi:DNA-binding transcriptional LysR family regulator